MDISPDADQAGLIRLNLGAGRRPLEGYIGVDIAGEPDVLADVRALPYEDGSVDEVIAIHLLEHLYRWEAPAALAEWARVLKPGGRLVLELPDVVKCCEQVLAGAKDRLGVWGLYGSPEYADPLMCHRWGWRSDELAAELRTAGFTRVRVREPQFHKKARDMRLEATR